MRAEKKMIVMPALIMITLSMTGVAVTHWSDVIYFEGTIKTGGLTLAFDQSEPPICTEFHEESLGGPLLPGEIYGGDVGRTVCSCQDLIMGQGYETMVVEIQNAYPSYLVHCVFFIHNIGSIPADICEFIVTDPTGALTWNPSLSALVDYEGDPVIDIERVGPMDEQIDPGDKVKAEFDFHIALDAEEGRTYYFEIAIAYTQWEQTVTTPDTGGPDGNWQSYLEVEISIDHPENYPILVNLPFAADNSIRFLENFNGTKDDIRENDFLSYWVDSDNNYRVWVRRLDNFTSGGGSDNVIYCLYENPLAAPMSSGENTFTYWKTENFLADWTVIGGSFTESNGILSSTGGGADVIVADSEDRGPGLLYEGKVRLETVLNKGSVDVVLGYVDGNNFYMGELWDYVAANNLRLYKRAGGNDIEIITSEWTPDTDWHVIGVRWESTTRLDLYCDYVYIGVSDDGNPAFTGGSFGFRMNKTPRQADWYRIRKFVSPEPTASAGAEQTIQ